MGDAGRAGSDVEQELRTTLAATLAVVQAQRQQIDQLRCELGEARGPGGPCALGLDGAAAAEEREQELILELAHEREARAAAEARLREASIIDRQGSRWACGPPRGVIPSKTPEEGFEPSSPLKLHSTHP